MLDCDSGDLTIFERLDRLKQLAVERNKKLAENPECNYCNYPFKCWYHANRNTEKEFDKLMEDLNARN